MGKSGIGKTTFLHLLSGLLTPTKGNVCIDGVDINKLSHSNLDKFRGQNIGLIFQKKYAMASLTILENLKMRLLFSKKKMDNDSIEGLLKELDLSTHKNHKTYELSEGQLQRLGIALGVVHKPKVILADEPTSSLDDENCFNVTKLLQKQAKQTNAALVVITHDSRIKGLFKNTIEL